MGLLGFQTLHCPKCDKTKVMPVGDLVWQEGKGQSFSAKGYFCIVCMLPFDAEGAIKKVKQLELEQKIEELQATSGR